MKLLFFAPRLHTNQYEILKGLKKKHKISFHSIYKGKTEDHSIIRPKIINQSTISIFLKKILGIKDNKLIFFPNINEYFFLLKREKPDYIIIRIYGKVYPYIIAIISKILKIKIIFYDQYDISLRHLKKKTLINFLKKIEIFFRCFLFESVIFSPIKSKKVFNKIFYLPFVSNVKVNKKLKTNKRTKILIVSKFQKRKNLLFAFEVLEILLKSYNFSVTYAGEVSNLQHKKIYHKLKNKIKNSKYSNNFNIFKNVSFKKMPDLYKKNDIFLLPANNEPASISILEAMSHGLVTICSDSCATKTYLPNLNKNVFKSNNKKDLMKSLKFYLDSNTNILKFKTINYKYCINNFTFDKYYQKLESILEYYEKK